MKVHGVACAILIGVISTPAIAGQTKWSRAPLFGDVVVRPPRGIPHPRYVARSAAVMPFPRARPAAAPAAAPVAIKADGSVATSTPSAPIDRAHEGDAPTKAPTSFPPAVGFE
jgi:hypothetical protein